MKYVSFIVVFFISGLLASCTTGNNSITGSWQLTEHRGNNGAHDFTESIKNGPIFTFKENGVIEKDNTSGTYLISESDTTGYHQDRLYIGLGTEKLYYIYQFESGLTTKLNLTPVTENYQLICDEGCTDVYKRL